jgi:hypothetical protein
VRTLAWPRRKSVPHAKGAEEFVPEVQPTSATLSKTSAVERILSRRDSTIVARHEVPGIHEENTPVPAGRLNRSRLRNQSLHPKSGRTSSDQNFQQGRLVFPKRHEYSTRYRLLMPGLRSTTNISGTDDAFDRPSGTGLSASLSRHFVPGYYRAVPPGQNNSPIEAPRIKLARVEFQPWESKAICLNSVCPFNFRQKPP